MTLTERLSYYANMTEKALEAALSSPNEALYPSIFKATRYSALGGGKRLRPALVLEFCRVCGGDLSKALPFAAALEMIHTYSLIHDDLPCMDNDLYRRGKESTWARFGEDMGVLAGDALIVEAFAVAARAFMTTAHPERVAKAIRILAEKTGIYGMIGGQVVDVELTDLQISKDTLDFIYRLKTGALLEASMMIGAALAGADEAELEKIGQIALDVGVAFQIQDDILDVTSSQEVLGKPVGSDEKNHKTTYVTLEGIHRARAEVERLSEEAIGLLASLEGKNEFLEELIRMLITRER